MHDLTSGRACLFGALALFLFSMPALARDGAGNAACPAGSNCITGLTATDLLGSASRLINAGRTADAAAILDGLQNLTADQETERAFLRGMIAMQEEDYETAASRFRDILASQPGLQRVRLELARALFLSRHDSAADYHFRLVLADHPPDAVAANINRFLAAIRERRVWSVDVQFGIVPDSNANAAPNDDRVDLFGLPFTLSRDAQQTGGIGIIASGQVTARPRLSRSVRLYSSAGVRHSDFFNGDFDDTIVSGEIGPEVSTSAGIFLPSLIYFHRWFGHEDYNSGIGGRLSWEKDVSRTWSLQISGEWRYIDNKVNDDLDGPFYLLGVLAQHRLDGRSYMNYQAVVRRTAAKAPAFAYYEPALTVGYGREFGLGVTAYFSVEAAPSFYDAASPAFGKVREDWRLNGSVSLVKRDWSWKGFAPLIRISYTRNLSNISFFEYKRLRGEFSVTRRF